MTQSRTLSQVSTLGGRVTTCENNTITGGAFSDGTLTLNKQAGNIQISLEESSSEEWEQIPVYRVHDPCFFNEGDIVRVYFAPDEYMYSDGGSYYPDSSTKGSGPYLVYEYIVSRTYDSEVFLNATFSSSYVRNNYVDSGYYTMPGIHISNTGDARISYQSPLDTIKDSYNRIYAVFRKHCTRLPQHTFPETDWHSEAQYGATIHLSKGKVSIGSIVGTYPTVAYLCVTIGGIRITDKVSVSNNTVNGTYASIWPSNASMSGDVVLYLYDESGDIITVLGQSVA